MHLHLHPPHQGPYRKKNDNRPSEPGSDAKEKSPFLLYIDASMHKDAKKEIVERGIEDAMPNEDSATHNASS